MTASRDRTNEFQSVVQLMRGRLSNGAASGAAASASEQHSQAKARLHQRSQFNQLARRVGADLKSTCAKVEKLALLAKRQSLFDDRVPEIQELTYIVRQDLNALNQAIGSLQNAARREQFSATSSTVDLLAKPSLLAQDDELHRTSSDVAIDMSGAEANWRRQQQALLDQNEDYLNSRADTMRNIEQTMVDLGQIFQQLATIVREQDEMVQRIDASVDQTTINVEGAHAELLKFFKTVSSNRRLMLKVFGVLIVFFVLFVVFLS
uniref:t-SNARE coiled-coil homology domain-containing protein n=1 Tax=Macrostomum lignano TaxID=282301 RepID=A0A1I8JDQ3_9PLAT